MKGGVGLWGVVISGALVAAVAAGATQTGRVSAPAPRADVPTYSKDVASIIQQHCQACHRQEKPARSSRAQGGGRRALIQRRAPALAFLSQRLPLPCKRGSAASGVMCSRVKPMRIRLERRRPSGRRLTARCLDYNVTSTITL
jgi:hypothetical protein